MDVENRPVLVNTGLSDEEIDVGNKIIAHFISLQKNDTMGGAHYLYNGKKFTDMYFHSSMDWLMPVMDKIERMGHDTSVVRRKVDNKVYYNCKIKKEGEEKEYVVNTVSSYKITAVWNAVIKFCSSYKNVKVNIKTT